MSKRIYIDDFCNDLNYQGIILYIGGVNYDNLLAALKRDYVNKTYRLEYAVTKKDLSMRNYIYIENCDLQDLDYPLYEYINDDGCESYQVYILKEDKESGKFYVETRL